MTSGSVSQEEIAAALAKSMADQFTPPPSVNPIPVGLPPLGMPGRNATSRDAAMSLPPLGKPPSGMPRSPTKNRP